MPNDCLDLLAPELLTWAAMGSEPPAPSPVKQALLSSYVMGSGYRRLVETGTYYGQTTRVVAGLGLKIDTIELSPELHALARARGRDLVGRQALALVRDRHAPRAFLQKVRTIFGVAG